MANKQIDMRDIKKIFKLHTEGVSKRKISLQLGLSRNTVTKYISFLKRYQLTYDEVLALSIEELHRLFHSQEKAKNERLLTLEQYFPYFDKELRKTGVTQQLLWEEYKERHPDGLMLSQFSYWYAEWRKAVSPVMHFTHEPGDKLFIDYTGKKLTIVDEHTGELKELEVYVCVLGNSHYTYVEASESQKREDFIRCTENALWFFGGVPNALIPDNLKAAVTKSDRYEPKVNEMFADFADYYGTSVLPTRAYKPRDKAIVENAVRIIYTRVFAKLRKETFHTISAINTRIIELLKIHNNMSFRGRSYTRASLFEEIEKPALNALPTTRYEIKQSSKGTVHKNGHIYLSKDKHYYSVPFQYLGKKVRIVYSEHLVEIYHAHHQIAVHSRSPKKYGYTTNKEHMSSYHKFVSDWNPQRFINWSVKIGDHCNEYIIKILDKKQHPEQSYKSCIGILKLADKVGNIRLNNACKRALDYQAYNYHIIVRILEKRWDQIQEIPFEDDELPLHNNIRGSQYYK